MKRRNPSILSKVMAEEGDEVPVGTIIASILKPGERPFTFKRVKREGSLSLGQACAEHMTWALLSMGRHYNCKIIWFQPVLPVRFQM